MSLIGTFETSRDVRYLVANGRKADMTVARADFRELTLAVRKRCAAVMILPLILGN